MWHRTIRIMWSVFFVWATVLGFSQGSLRWVIVPLFTMVCAFIAQEYISKHYPSFSGRVNFALGGLLLIYHVGFTFWPSFVTHLPQTAKVLVEQKQNLDITASTMIDPGPLRARQALRTYLQQKFDVEGKAINDGFDQLIQKQTLGTVDPETVKAAEHELIARYQRLVQQSDELKRIDKLPIQTPAEAVRATDQTASASPGNRPPSSQMATSFMKRNVSPPRAKPNPRLDALKAEYDSLENRFRADEQTLRYRASDLGNQPVKPEITSAIETCRSDLAAARVALSVGDIDAAALRTKRVRTALKDLESY